MSDLHFEFHADGGKSFCDALPNDNVDVLVVAGDLATNAILFDSLSLICKRFENSEIVYVHGNHEFYHASREQVMKTTSRAMVDNGNLHVLDKTSVTIDGVRFVGAPLWFAREPYAPTEGMTDFRVIQGFTKWVYDENTAARAYLAREVRAGDVVVTHHLPHPAAVAPRWRGNRLNAFFLSDMSSVLRDARPALWIFGHTHDACDTIVEGGSRIVCNPYGYHNIENTRFDPSFTVEVRKTQ